MKELFIRFTVRVFRERCVINLCVCLSISFGYDGWMWDLIELITDHCLSFYFSRLLFEHVELNRWFSFAPVFR